MGSDATKEEHNGSSFEIKTLTPLWTGDIRGNSTYARETSIIGSLRWWYEALVRGLGGHACDPTNTSCNFNYSEYKKTGDLKDGLRSVCDSCYLFGCTGWGRRFRLEMRNGEPTYYGKLRITVDRNMGWYLRGGLCGSLDARILNTSKDGYRSVVLSLVKFVSNWGGIGAKTQQGYGICHLTPKENTAIPNVDELMRFIRKNRDREASQQQDHLPNIRDFFFCKVHLNDVDIGNDIYMDKPIEFSYQVESPDKINNKDELLNHLKEKCYFLPTAPIIRYHIRKLFEKDDLRHFLMGFITGRNGVQLRIGNKSHRKMGSKIYVSHAFKVDDKWEIRIWGWIPTKLLIINNRGREMVELEKQFGEKRDEILKKLKEGIEDVIENGIFERDSSPLIWREFDSERDTQERISDIERFIQSLGDSQ